MSLDLSIESLQTADGLVDCFISLTEINADMIQVLSEGKVDLNIYCSTIRENMKALRDVLAGYDFIKKTV